MSVSRPPRGDTTSYEDRKWKESVAAQINALLAGGGGGYTNEQAQDAIGTILVDSASVDFTYSDATPSITATVKWTETEIDFGSTPVWEKTFTITDTAVSGASKIIPTPSGNVATGRVGNDLEWDNLLLGALAGAGSFLLTVIAYPGPIMGKRKIHYQVA